MSLVIDTYSDYFFYLQYRRWTVPATIKANKLALKYFAILYGYMETDKLLPTHMIRFREFLHNRKREQKNSRGEYVGLSEYSIYKVMIKLRAYIRRLESEKKLGDLKPIDVPIGDVPCPVPKYLTQEELKVLLAYLDTRVIELENSVSVMQKYTAYLHRAIVRFLYTTWLRNTELRTLKLHDVNADWLMGEVIGKGRKHGVITFSNTAKEHLSAYLALRAKMFPWVDFDYIFTAFKQRNNKAMTEQGLNRMLRNIGVKAGLKTKVFTHIFRHSLATHLMQFGYTIVQVRDKMRHSNLSVTNVYTHSNPTEQMAMTKNIDNAIERIV